MSDGPDNQHLPDLIEQYLTRVAGRIRNRRVRRDVRAELRSHFAEALSEVHHDDTGGQEELAKTLIAEFGDVKLLGQLIKRAKKRCRPLWVKFLVRSAQAAAVLIVLLVVYVISFLTAKPTPTVNYVAELNRMTRPDVPESLNAAPHYLKATELYVKPPDDVDAVAGSPGCPLEGDEREKLTDWIRQNEPALDEFREGATKPYCWFQYQGEEMISILLPHLDWQRNLARALLWRNYLEDLRDGPCVNNLRTVYMAGRHVRPGGGFLIEQLVGIAIDALADRQTCLALREGRIGPDAYKTLATMLAQICPQGYPDLDFRGERLCWWDMVQRTFTAGGVGGGHIIPRNLLAVCRPDEFERWPESLIVAGCLLNPRRDATVEQLNEYYAILQRISPLTPYQLAHSNDPRPADTFVTELKEGHRDLFLASILPALSRAIEINCRGRADHQATQTVVAVLRFQTDAGRPPETLDELVPKYLRTVPRDPYSDGPLVYRRTDGDFVLYSIGADFKDNGGEHDGRWGQEHDKPGDYVFWPPPPITRPGK